MSDRIGKRQTDCGNHQWYNHDGVTDQCYHCTVGIRDHVDYGCAFCADDQNRLFGEVTQIGSNEERQMILLRCPLCHTLYENTPRGSDNTRRLTEVEAERLYPGFRQGEGI